MFLCWNKNLIKFLGTFTSVIYENKQTQLAAKVLHNICVTAMSSMNLYICSSGTTLIYTEYVYSQQGCSIDMYINYGALAMSLTGCLLYIITFDGGRSDFECPNVSSPNMNSH